MSIEVVRRTTFFLIFQIYVGNESPLRIRWTKGDPHSHIKTRTDCADQIFSMGVPREVNNGRHRSDAEDKEKEDPGMGHEGVVHSWSRRARDWWDPVGRARSISMCVALRWRKKPVFDDRSNLFCSFSHRTRWWLISRPVQFHVAVSTLRKPRYCTARCA